MPMSSFFKNIYIYIIKEEAATTHPPARRKSGRK